MITQTEFKISAEIFKVRTYSFWHFDLSFNSRTRLRWKLGKSKCDMMSMCDLKRFGDKLRLKKKQKWLQHTSHGRQPWVSPYGDRKQKQDWLVFAYKAESFFRGRKRKMMLSKVFVYFGTFADYSPEEVLENLIKWVHQLNLRAALSVVVSLFAYCIDCSTYMWDCK